MKPSLLELRAVATWLRTGDTGESSMSLCAIFLGLPSKHWKDVAYPHDPSDLGRCISFLHCLPERRVKPLLQIAAAYRKEWRAIYEHWDELLHLYYLPEVKRTGRAHDLYVRMKTLGL